MYMARLRVAEGQQEKVKSARLQKGWKITEEDIRPLYAASQCLIEQYAQENNWSDNDQRWLDNFTDILRVDKHENIDEVKTKLKNSPGSLLQNIKKLIDQGDIVAKGISYRTWKSFSCQRTRRYLNQPAFQAYCQALGLKWQEIAEIPQSRENAIVVYHNLPASDCIKLVGRKIEIHQILDLLSSRDTICLILMRGTIPGEMPSL
jgi:hypothetical protein